MYWLSRPVVKTYTGTMLNMNVKKHTEMPDGPKIIAANHPTTTDPFFVASMVQQQTFILINELLFKVPILGAYLRRSGHIPVIAGQGQQAIDAALEHLAAGHNVMIFPEGALSPFAGSFHRARTGVARLAVQSGAPVVPVGISLSWDRIRTVRSTVQGRVEYGRWYLTGPYHMTVGQAMTFQGDVNDREYIHKVADTVMRRIGKLAGESNRRMRPGIEKLRPAFNDLA
jgi:1-acyl-sn-glycerol-3-phosphate acyltransferase